MPVGQFVRFSPGIRVALLWGPFAKDQRLKIVIFCHPAFMRSQSMPRFARMLKSAYEARGYSVQVWAPHARIFNLVPTGRLSKWAGYIDEHVLFPIQARMALKHQHPDTLYVFCDQALGSWVPMVKHLPHVIHVHDLLALRSALGEIPENPTSITGKIYQRFIRRGFRQGRHFISVSKKTREDLHRVGHLSAVTSDVVYNGMNYPFSPLARPETMQILREANLPAPDESYLLHVGGGQWYKNLVGVIALYAQYAKRQRVPLPLWCIGPQPSCAVRSALGKVPPHGRVSFFQSVESRTLQALYSGARAFLFPSLAEGFGWPLVEAQACGCPVLTTDEAPMNEIAGRGAFYVPRLQIDDDIDAWAAKGAAVLDELLLEPPEQSNLRRQRGIEWAQRFNTDKTIEDYIDIYSRVLSNGKAEKGVAPSLENENNI